MAAQLERRRERLAGGERPLGWKLGFGAAAAQAKLGTEAPLVGFLTSASLLEDGAEVDIAGWGGPALEPEIAVHMGSDLPGGGDRTDAEAAIAAIGPAFELAAIEFAPEDPERILAHNIFHRRVVVGPTREGASTEGLRGVIVRDGEPFADTEEPEAATGEIVSLVSHVAEVLEAHGERLRAGEVVICGSIVPPIQIAPGQQFGYELAPIGALGLRFAPA
jgi:2-keto-4-pentenoate hydratase